MFNDKKDVGFIDDAIFYLQNAIAAENHAIISSTIVKDEKLKRRWLELAMWIRRNRSKKMYYLIPQGDDERYCYSKHILSMAISLKELGNRKMEENDEKTAIEYFNEAEDLEMIFKLISGGKL